MVCSREGEQKFNDEHAKRRRNSRAISGACNHCSILAISIESNHDVYKDWTGMLPHLSCVKKQESSLDPSQLIGGRWLKSPLVKAVHGVHCEDVATYVFVDEKKKASSILCTSRSSSSPTRSCQHQGSGSRIPSRLEKAVKLKNKLLSQCKKCLEWGHHDSRNCNKFKEKEKRISRRHSDD
ncbi:hypothetical protein SASPL_137875 [Salvia splendens]|uniref:Uncharacterized protein n=1 Tax=Salvia splendens TaxID=180675 RepID=A0A8X8WV94_SALSN|nr:hypothetical protein SASPL_137875 [Salvia splendens]